MFNRSMLLNAKTLKKKRFSFKIVLLIICILFIIYLIKYNSFSDIEHFLDRQAGYVVFYLNKIMFFPIFGLPAVLLWLLIAALYLTINMRFINIRAFIHAIDVVRGKFSKKDEKGEVTHFQALASALSATVGLGNIANVSIAISIGGPGATFWMIVAGILGMTSKFTECSLGQIYRKINKDGKVSGGPMFYLSDGLRERGYHKFGKVLAVCFSVICIISSFAGGNMFQMNQSLGSVKQFIPYFVENEWLYGLIMSFLVGIVIIGGIKRIAHTAEKIVPTMCGIYIIAVLIILILRFEDIPTAFIHIITGAFTPEAGYGGFVGVLIQGIRRGVFSNEAGAGSAAIAHSAAKTNEPIREGIVALLEPFIDTVVICTMTALVIVITGAYHEEGVYQIARDSGNGALLTSLAFESELPWFPPILSIAIFLFAYSTMISWSYYGERCWAWLFNENTIIIYKILFLVFVVIGSIISATNVINLSDMIMLTLAFPNLLGIYFLAPKVNKLLKIYMLKLKNGNFEKLSE